jgi:hypothetical protein
MFKRKNLETERGSIEVIILVVVTAAIIGLVAWRIAETQKTQLDTEAAISNNQTTVPPQSNVVVVDALNAQFTVPEGHGRVTLTNAKGGDMASVDLVSQKLKAAESTCEGENTGVFGTLGVVDTAEGAPQPQYTKEVDGKMIGFTMNLKNCYNAELMTAFRETVPKAIVESLEAISKPNAATSEKEQ